jgi:hypothetical protein
MLSNTDVVMKYLGKPDRIVGDSNLYFSPFRVKEKTPSFSVNDEKGVTDFGTGIHYNQIEFVSELFNISDKEAKQKIVKDFKLDKYNYIGRRKTNMKNKKIELREGNKPENILAMFDSVSFKTKPSNIDIPNIKNRIDKDLKFCNYNIEKVKDLLVTGHTIIPSGIKANAKENWQQQQVFLIDIDNKIDKKDIYVEDENHVTVEKILVFCKEKNIIPTFIYTTFSHTEHQHKFRLVYVFEKTIKKIDVAEQIPIKLLELLKKFNPDTAPKNLSSMFFRRQRDSI